MRLTLEEKIDIIDMTLDAVSDNNREYYFDEYLTDTKDLRALPEKYLDEIINDMIDNEDIDIEALHDYMSGSIY